MLFELCAGTQEEPRQEEHNPIQQKKKASQSDRKPSARRDNPSSCAKYMSHAVGVAAAAATAAVLGIVSQELRTAKVAGSSMAPTFQTGSSILIERVSLFLGAVCHAALPLIEHRRRMDHLATSATGFAAMAVANLDQASPRLVARTFKLVAASHPSPG